MIIWWCCCLLLLTPSPFSHLSRLYLRVSVSCCCCFFLLYLNKRLYALFWIGWRISCRATSHMIRDIRIHTYTIFDGGIFDNGMPFLYFSLCSKWALNKYSLHMIWIVHKCGSFRMAFESEGFFGVVSISSKVIAKHGEMRKKNTLYAYALNWENYVRHHIIRKSSPYKLPIRSLFIIILFYCLHIYIYLKTLLRRAFHERWTASSATSKRGQLRIHSLPSLIFLCVRQYLAI